MGAPKLLMLDEPLEGLAPVICDMLMEAFERLSSSTTIILVEQHTALALDFAKRVIVLEESAASSGANPNSSNAMSASRMRDGA